MKSAILLFLLLSLIYVNRPCSQELFSAGSDLKSFKDSSTILNDSGFYIKSTDGKSFLKIYGSIRLNGAYDIDGLQSQQNFSTYDIPTGDENIEGRFFMSPFQTRLGFSSLLNTSLGVVTTKLESDFLGTDNAFRIRHAFAVFYRFLLGKTTSVFGDANSIPNTVDSDGPNSSVNERTIQLRFFQAPDAKIKWAVAVESPNPDITTSDTTQPEPAYQTFPDVTSNVRIESKWGHLQLAGVFRSISVRNSDESLKILAGYGGLFSGRITFPRGYKMNFQFMIGKGISRYIKGLTGKGEDVIYDPQTQNNVLLAAYGGFLSGNRQWTKVISTDITFGMLNIDNHDFQPGNAFRKSFYFSCNMFFLITKGCAVGIEFDHGRRINKDASSGSADRISFIGAVNF